MFNLVQWFYRRSQNVKTLVKTDGQMDGRTGCEMDGRRTSGELEKLTKN